ncbi:MAG TPA: helix-turn-helix transcriptional regulator [Candidatus Limnocylindrales bacterium]|nr:helix-turn-helix transcriptional regulator [Candidatus Limnocylindrales bacterium]
MNEFSVPMPMSQSPAVARLIVRVALREAREIGSMTQGQVAKSLDWSLSKIQRIESGDVTVSTTDLMAMVRHFGNVTTEDADRLVELVRVSRKGTGWWDQPEYKAHLSAPTLELIQFEGEAAVIRAYNPHVVPGILQTQAYTESVFDKWNPRMDPECKRVKLEARGQRGPKVFDRQPPPDYEVLLDESVLYRQVGPVDVMAAQLDDLLRRVAADQVSIGILTYEAALPEPVHPFTLLGFGDTYSVLYEETSPQDRIITDAEQIELHRLSFERMWQAGVEGPAATDLVKRRLKDLRKKKST